MAAVERLAPSQPVRAVHREVGSGESYRVVTVLYAPDELRSRLGALGWEADVRTVGWRFFCATIRRR